MAYRELDQGAPALPDGDSRQSDSILLLASRGRTAVQSWKFVLNERGRRSVGPLAGADLDSIAIDFFS